MRIPPALRSAAEFLRALIKDFNQGNSGLVAAAVSFYVFLSLAPLLLLAVAALGFILRSEQQAYRTVMALLHSYQPALAEHSGASIRSLLTDLVKGSGAATGFGIVALLWAGSQAFVNLETAINIAWNCRPRSFLKGRLIAIGLLVAVGVLLLISFGITTAEQAIPTPDVTIFGHRFHGFFGWARGTVAFLLPIVVSIATFTLIYKLLPNTLVPLSSALLGGVITGVLWEIAKQGFSWYVTHFANYSAVYGSLASVILLLVWIYYSSVITLVGAHISAIHEARRRART